MKPEKTKGGGWEPAFTLVEQLAAETSLGLSSCYQGKKCSSGCPRTFAQERGFDAMTHRDEGYERSA